jgi:hypothetical protein
LQNSFGEPFWGIGLKNRSFGAIALDSSFGEQLLVATLGRSFREPLCRMGSSFGEQLWGLMIFGTQLWGAAFGSNFAGQLSGPALENSFGEPGWFI